MTAIGQPYASGTTEKSVEVVQRIGRRLAGGQTLNDPRLGIADRIAQLTASAATVTGTTMPIVIAASVAVIDRCMRTVATTSSNSLPVRSEPPRRRRDLLIRTPADLARKRSRSAT